MLSPVFQHPMTRAHDLIAWSQSIAVCSFQAHPHHQLWRCKEEDFQSRGKVASKEQGAVRESISNGILLALNEEYMEVNFEFKLNFDRGKTDGIVHGDGMERIEDPEAGAVVGGK